MPAYRQLGMFRARELSPSEVLKAQIARIEGAAGQINAITCCHFDEAMEAAHESEARYRDGTARPLEGITVAVKEEFDRRGWMATSGSVLLKDNVSHQNHPVIDKVLDAGAILHVQTTVPEFFLVAVTWSDLWGVTRNPWNLDCTPGGSSGGSAAALAAGVTTPGARIGYGWIDPHPLLLERPYNDRANQAAMLTQCRHGGSGIIGGDLHGSCGRHETCGAAATAARRDSACIE